MKLLRQDREAHLLRRFLRRYAHLPPVAFVFQAVEQAVFHDGLQNEVGDLSAPQVRVNVIFTAKLRIAAAHQLHIGLQQLQLVIQRHHLPVHLHAEPEEIHQPHEEVRHLFIPVQLGLDADGIQRIVQKMGIHLAFQVQHGHLLLRQLRPEDVRAFQRQVKRQRHQGDAHAADEPGVAQPL